MLTLAEQHEIDALKREVNSLRRYKKLYEDTRDELKETERKLRNETRKRQRYEKLVNESSKVAQVKKLVEQGLTVNTIAEKLFVSVRYVQKIKRGDNKEPSKSQQARNMLSNGYDVDTVATKCELTEKHVKRLKRKINSD